MKDHTHTHRKWTGATDLTHYPTFHLYSQSCMLTAMRTI